MWGGKKKRRQRRTTGRDIGEARPKKRRIGEERRKEQNKEEERWLARRGRRGRGKMEKGFGEGTSQVRKRE